MGRRKKGVIIANDLGRSTVNNSQTTRRRRSQKNPARFSNYVFKVLKQVHPQLSMTNKAMKVMDDFMHDIYLRLVSEAAGLVKLTKRSTLSASEFQTATRLILPGELAKHAISEASKAVANFLTSKNEDAKRSHARRVINNPPSTMTVAGNNQEPVEIEIFGTVPRSLLSNTREVVDNDDLEVSMEENELVKDVEFTRKMTSIVPPVATHPHIENTNAHQNTIYSHGTTHRVLPIEKTVGSQVMVDVPEENLTDEENASSIPDESGPPTPPMEVESDTVVVSETQVDGGKKKLSDKTEIASIAEAETQPMSMDEEEEETQPMPMDEEAETQPMNSHSASDRDVETDTLLIVDVVGKGNIRESSSVFSDTRDGSLSDNLENRSFLSGGNEALMTDCNNSTNRDAVESSSLTVRCTTITSTKTTTLVHERKEKVAECWSNG